MNTLSFSVEEQPVGATAHFIYTRSAHLRLRFLSVLRSSAQDSQDFPLLLCDIRNDK